MMLEYNAVKPDKISTRICSLLAWSGDNITIQDALQLTVMKAMRECINDALARAIVTNRAEQAFELIDFSRDRNMNLAITEKTMMCLIQNNMYHVIEDLIIIRTMLRIDYDKLDRDAQMGVVAMEMRR